MPDVNGIRSNGFPEIRKKITCLKLSMYFLKIYMYFILVTLSTQKKDRKYYTDNNDNRDMLFREFVCVIFCVCVLTVYVKII